MAVTKHKDADWAYYLDQIAQSGGKVSESDLQEFAGFLLKRDMQQPIVSYSTFKTIMMSDTILIGCLVSYLVAESPETIADLLNELKRIVLSFYKNEIAKLIEIKMQVINLEDDGA